MLDFNTLAEFSRTHCVAICAFLVPANLITTIVTIAVTVIRHPKIQVWQTAIVASLFAIAMLLHVYTWFMIGVVMAPTYILLSLAITCLLTNASAVLWEKKMMVNRDRQNTAIQKA